MNQEYLKEQLRYIYHQKDYSNIAKHISKLEYIHILTRADELVNDIVLYDKPWDMECCLQPYHFMGDFSHSANGDEEWCYMLNRMDYLEYLMLAGELTKHTVYLYKAKEWILHWIHDHSTIQFEPSTRPLDTGIRILNIVEMLPIFLYHSICNDEELEIIVQSLKLQLQYLKASYLPKYKLSNWGSIQTISILCTMPFLYENFQQYALFQWALQEVALQFEIQVYDDGMLWEQSTMYHVEVAIYGMKLLYYSNVFRFEIDPIVFKNTKNLCSALLYLTTPHYEIDAYGDSDVVSVKDVLSCASVILQCNSFAIGDSIQLHELYSYGASFASLYQKRKGYPSTRVFDGSDSGMYTTRSDWSTNASFTTFVNGSLGSGHGHCDNLHVSLYYKGHPILIDSGRFTYREDIISRVYLKRMIAHNSVIVDDIEPSLPKDSWTYECFASPLKTYVKHKNHLHYYEGSIHSKNALWIRKMIVIDPSIWVIFDEIHQEGKHNVKSYFHLDPHLIWNKQGNVYNLQHDLSIDREEESFIQRMQCSKTYNTIMEQDVIVYESAFTDNYQSMTCICSSQYERKHIDILQNLDEAVANDLASSIQIQVSTTERYTIVVFHKEVYKGKKIFSCDGVPFHGKCVIIHRRGDQTTVYRMKV